MDTAVNVLESFGYDLSKFSVLEMFGRDGTQTVCEYVDKVGRIKAFEVSPEYGAKLKRLIGDKGQVVYKDSVAWLLGLNPLGPDVMDDPNLFDLIVVDNPQGLFCENRYCEHFEFARDMLVVMKNECFVLWVVNDSPYDPRTSKKIEESKDTYGMSNADIDLWFARRCEFYGRSDPLDRRFLIRFYEDMFADAGIQGCVVAFRSTPSNVEGKAPYMHRLLVNYRM